MALFRWLAVGLTTAACGTSPDDSGQGASGSSATAGSGAVAGSLVVGGSGFGGRSNAGGSPSGGSSVAGSPQGGRAAMGGTAGTGGSAAGSGQAGSPTMQQFHDMAQAECPELCELERAACPDVVVTDCTSGCEVVANNAFAANCSQEVYDAYKCLIGLAPSDVGCMPVTFNGCADEQKRYNDCI